MRSSVDIIIPVFNEEESLPRSIMLLVDYANRNLFNPWRIIIADNGSTDQTQTIAEALGQRFPGVEYLSIPRKGRGIALKTAWLDSNADIVLYMDVDLSTDLTALPIALDALETRAHIAVGSRLLSSSKTTRSFKRSLLSICYNMLIKLFFFSSFSDAQCGFKAMTRETAELIVPHIVNNNWFFDTELLIIADQNKFLIEEIPVTWIEDSDSRVNIIKTITEDIKGLLRLRLHSLPKIVPPVITVEAQDHVGDHPYK